MPDYVSLKLLATQLGMDKSHARRWLLKNGFQFATIRTADSLNQAALALSPADAEAARDLRARQGFGPRAEPVDVSAGFFYLIQLVPDLDIHRIKLGFANDVPGRLQAHQCTCPNAVLVKCWPCQRSWEPAALASLGSAACKPVGHPGTEVFQCNDLAALVERGDRFFAMLPG